MPESRRRKSLLHGGFTVRGAASPPAILQPQGDKLKCTEHNESDLGGGGLLPDPRGALTNPETWLPRESDLAALGCSPHAQWDLSLLSG